MQTFFAAYGLGHVSIGDVCRIKQGVGEVVRCRLLEWEMIRVGRPPQGDICTHSSVFKLKEVYFWFILD